MESVEEIINIPKVVGVFADLVARNKVQQVMDEIVLQSRVEFNVGEESET